MPLSTIDRFGQIYWWEEAERPRENHQPVASDRQT